MTRLHLGGIGLVGLLLVGGCAYEGEENYKVLQEDRPLFETEPPDRVQPGASQGPAVPGGPQAVMAVATVDEPATQPAVSELPTATQSITVTEDHVGGTLILDTQAAPATQPTTAAAEDTSLRIGYPAVTTRPAESDQVPLLGLDRSYWPRIVVGPVDGTVEHHPIYFQDLALDEPTADIIGAPTTEAQLELALEQAEAAGYSGANALGVIAQPVVFFVDVALLPVKLVTVPPWTKQTSP